MSVPEFSRPVRLDTIGDVPRTVEIVAEAAERIALARRFDFVALNGIRAGAQLSKQAGGMLVEGSIDARVIQRCVATAVELPELRIEEPFRLLFAAPAAGGEDVELSADDLDVLPLEDGAIDLGEVAAETLALALDPYPRAPDADNALRAAGVKTEAEAGPFAALAVLREKLSER